MQARSLSAGPLIAASIAVGMPSGSEGNAQAASGVIVMDGSRSPGALTGDVPEPARNIGALF